MASLAEQYAAKGKAQTNPYRQKAEVLAAGAKNIKDDRYGYGGIARIPIMAMYGGAAGKASRRDDENAQAMDDFVTQNAKSEEDKAALKSKFQIMSKVMDYVNNGNTGSAVQMANMFRKELGISEGVNVTSLMPGKEDGPGGKDLKVELTDTKSGGKQIIAFNKGGAWSLDPKTNKFVQMSEEDLATLGRSDKTGTVGSTKERILAKIAQDGYERLTANEKEAWDLQSNSSKTIALEVLKTLRASEEYKALNDENDPEGTRRDNMIKSATATVEQLFNDPSRTQADEVVPNEAAPGPDLGGSGVDVIRGQYGNDPGYRDIGGGGQPAAQPQVQPQPTGPDMSQARQAPDGNFYLPDPQRPGKYLLVEE